VSSVKNQEIVYFDGVCNICNTFVDFLLSCDHDSHFLVASLQGETAKKNLPNELRENIDYIVVQTHESFFKKSKAVFYILSKLGRPYRYIAVLRFFPTFITDWGYDLVAKSRYRIFGKRDSCRLPTAEEKAKFLP